ncbi:prolyl oligopeptidase family protein [mine drainage metagenome]|uniref:Prolyl oligopeptidase family protein n=2 Tax=mine drainage metagenome TaxID=410659 RepID=T1BUM2_9ZZZZ
MRLAEPRPDQTSVYWLESAPEDETRMTVFGIRGATLMRLTPPGYGVRSRVHEYGGGAYIPTAHGIVFVGDQDQALYRVLADGRIEHGLGLASDRYADLSTHPDPDRIAAVVERRIGPGEPQNFVGLCNLRDHTCAVLCQGADFYLAPRIDPAGRRICWIEWNHPDMPWQGTRLRVGRLSSTGEVVEVVTVAGSRTESILEPSWGPQGGLYFLSDRTGFPNLYRWHPDQGTVALCHKRAELGRPPWNLGQSSYGFSGANTVWAAFTRRAQNELWRLNLTDGSSRRVSLPLGDLTHLSVSGRRIVALFNSADHAPAILMWSRERPERPRTLRGGFALPGFRAAPESIEFPGPRGARIQAFFYRPPSVPPPFPLLIRCHGGPTAMASSAHDARIQNWISLGLAVLDVNYRGSSGFGRAYREALTGCWGCGEVDDIEWGIRFLVRKGLAQKSRLYLTGSSAGGLTVLGILMRYPHFQAASLLYPVTDLLSLEKTAPKFESHYGQFLIGGTARQSERYLLRSPLSQVERLPRIPLLLFQGLEDPVVPPEDARRFAVALGRQGVPVRLVEFAGEGHGFRQSKNLARVFQLESELFSPTAPTA